MIMLCVFYAGAGNHVLWAALGATALVITCCTVFSETDQFLLPKHMARHGISPLQYVSCPSTAVATPNWHVISGLFGSDTHNSGFCFLVWFGLVCLSSFLSWAFRADVLNTTSGPAHLTFWRKGQCWWHCVFRTMAALAAVCIYRSVSLGSHWGPRPGEHIQYDGSSSPLSVRWHRFSQLLFRRPR